MNDYDGLCYGSLHSIPCKHVFSRVQFAFMHKSCVYMHKTFMGHANTGSSCAGPVKFLS